MKTLICGLTMSLGMMASGVSAQQTLNVDGTDYPLAELMATCQGMTDNPGAQIACFSDISRLLEEQAGEVKEDVLSVADALDALRSVAQYQDDDTGLSIAGSDCSIQIVYYNNYFHVSRRNISEIDLFSVQFDASQLQHDQTVQVQSGMGQLSKGVMVDGATAIARGGAALDSAQNNFAPRSPRMTLAGYAAEVIGQLPASESQAFNFVLVHPARSQASADIWSAFDNFIKSCRG